MKPGFLKNSIQRQQVGIFCLVLCANLALLLGLLAASAHFAENDESARLFAGASLLAGLKSLWLGIRAAKSPVFLNYRRAAQVYYPGIAISILLALFAHLAVQLSWNIQKPLWVLIATAALFMVLCLGIKLMNARHALD